MSNHLGEELRRLRKERGLTLDEAAEQTGITKQYMSMLETGQRKSASFEIMFGISKSYGVPLDYFTNFINVQEKPNMLTEKELYMWNSINEKIQEDIFYKKDTTLKEFLFSFFMKNRE